jgi:hypothetical protein
LNHSQKNKVPLSKSFKNKFPHTKIAILFLPKTKISDLNPKVMEKQPFNEAGLEHVLQSLYALPDADLTEASYAFRNQPKLWIVGHFTLEPAQLEFLEKMTPAATSFLGHQGGFAMEHRLPVTLIKKQDAAPLPKGDKEQDKLFKPTSNFAVQTDSMGQDVVSGDLKLEVTYLHMDQDKQPNA